jgi:hypothetical protein
MHARRSTEKLRDADPARRDNFFGKAIFEYYSAERRADGPNRHGRKRPRIRIL